MVHNRRGDATGALARATFSGGRSRGPRTRIAGAVEAERRRIARELHDGCGQDLTALLLEARHLEGARSVREVRAEARRLRRRAARILAEVERIARGLQPAALDDLGLAPALRRAAADAAHAHRLAVRVETRGAIAGLPAAQSLALYRIAQEALANAVRHAHAKAVTVRLVRSRATVTLTVRDDGRGFAVAEGSGVGTARLGLTGMRERAAALGGTLALRSAERKGTTVTARLPLGAARSPAAPSSRRARR